MTTRSSETVATFVHPFRLPAFEGWQPAGTYRVVIDEELIDGLSFLAWQRVATFLHTPAIGSRAGEFQVFPTTAEELAAALAIDAGGGPMPQAV